MSILIKGIDLPKDREFILLKVFPDGKTRIGLSTNYIQAIQIDRPHGRLIDESALFEDLNKYQIEYNADVNETICDIPTILEAEE